MSFSFMNTVLNSITFFVVDLASISGIQ